MLWLANDITTVLWIAVVPAFLAVFLLIVALREPKSSDQATRPKNRLTLTDARRLPRRFWLVVALGMAFTLARFSEAFLILRATDVGLALGWVPAIHDCHEYCLFPLCISSRRGS